MTSSPPRSRFSGVFALPEIRAMLGARLMAGLVKSGLATVVGYQVYEITGNPFALGLLGLTQAIPGVGLALYGGHLADRRDRRAITLVTTWVVFLSVLILAAISFSGGQYALLGILIVILAYGTAWGLNRPAQSALEAQVVPFRFAAKGASALTSVWQLGSIAGPPIAGVAYALVGPTITYLGVAGLLAAELFFISLIAPRPAPPPPAGGRESLRQNLTIGIRYVLGRQPLVGSMALDLFAVLFGGVVAIMPIYATDILHVGPAGLGVLNTAPAIGALLVMTAATRRPPTQHAGRVLLLCVAGFGVSMLIFAVSTNFLVSMLALFLGGVTDGLSVVIRTVILRVFSPEHLRGRIAAVNWIFIGTSNEIGAFESGTAAGILGTVPSVIFGASLTLLVVGVVALRMPELRRLNLDEVEELPMDPGEPGQPGQPGQPGEPGQPPTPAASAP